MNEQSPSIAVVMSTYNGEQHVAAQINSVLAQDVENLSLYIRDDGSVDNTHTILKSYEDDKRVHVVCACNEGVVDSFLDGIALVPRDVDYIALCDQDDVWHTDKLRRALQVLSKQDNTIAQLYCSEYHFCDAEMNPTGPSHLNRRGVSFPTMLYENMVSGNTTVVNRVLADAIIEAGKQDVYCHDWWMALMATTIGNLTYDDFESLDYRRTGSNTSPTGSGALQLLRYRLKTFFADDNLSNITKQLQRIWTLYANDMAPEKRALLNRMLTAGRWTKAFTPVRLRQKFPEEIALRLLFIAGKL